MIRKISVGKDFKFKLVTKKTKEPKIVYLTKTVRGICIKDGGHYSIQVKADILDPSKTSEVLSLDFTEDSYNLKGLKSIFSRERDEHGNYVRIIRREDRYKHFTANKDRFVPFCHNWICSGRIVKHAGKLMFEFKDCIAPKGYKIAVINDDD